MSNSRLPVLIVLALLAAVIGWWWYGHSAKPAGSITVYYTKLDGQTEVPWHVSLGPAHDLQSVAFYAAAQALAGPAPDVQAVRFPVGTHTRSVHVDGSTVTVDLSAEVTKSGGGSFSESGAFKALVWTMTGISGVSAVAVRVEGAKVTTLPGGHLEIDEPLTRANW